MLEITSLCIPELNAQVMPFITPVKIFPRKASSTAKINLCLKSIVPNDALI